MESLVWLLKTISSLKHFKTPFNAYCSLVLVSKDGRTRKKTLFFLTVGTFSLTRSILLKNFLKHVSIKFAGYPLLLNILFGKVNSVWNCVQFEQM